MNQEIQNEGLLKYKLLNNGFNTSGPVIYFHEKKEYLLLNIFGNDDWDFILYKLPQEAYQFQNLCSFPVYNGSKKLQNKQHADYRRQIFYRFPKPKQILIIDRYNGNSLPRYKDLKELDRISKMSRVPLWRERQWVKAAEEDYALEWKAAPGTLRDAAMKILSK